MGEDRLIVIREVPQLITNFITVLIREYATAVRSSKYIQVIQDF